MKILHCFAKPVSYAVTASLLTTSLHLPLANAAMVGTEAAINGIPAQQEAALMQDTLNREAVKAKLLSLGVDSIQVQARVDALTQSEAQKLAHQLDQLPAAGTDAITILLVILLLLFLL